MAPGLVELDVSTMCLGSVLEEANKALREAIGHCERHPGIKKPRSVKIEIHLEPDIHEDTGEFALNITHCSVPIVPKTWGKGDRAAKRDGLYQVIGNPQFAPLEANQISLAEHMARVEASG